MTVHGDAVGTCETERIAKTNEDEIRKIKNCLLGVLAEMSSTDWSVVNVLADNAYLGQRREDGLEG